MILTFRDFPFVARHLLAHRSDAAGHEHWHSYVARCWFDTKPDQTDLAHLLQQRLQQLCNANLNAVLDDTTDEGLAQWIMQETGAVRVRVTNDGQRGAECW